MAFLKLPAGRLRVYLAADNVGAVLERGWLRRRVECASAQVAPDEAGAQPWAPAVRALAELIAGRGWRGMAIDVALSSEFVRFALVPGIRRQLSSLEMQGLAQGMFTRVLGETASDWSVRYCATDRATLLGAAAQKPLLAALEDSARACHCTLRSVSPLWSCVANQQRARLGRRSAWLVLAEPRATAYGLLERGRWRVVRAKALDLGQGLNVARLVERESRYLGTGTRDAVVAGEPQEGAFPPDWKVERVPLALARFGALPADCRPASLAGT